MAHFVRLLRSELSPVPPSDPFREAAEGVLLDTQHKQKLVEGFTQKYNITMLVYYEVTNDVQAALAREKQIKGWRRSKKIALIESANPQWRDLSADWGSSPSG